MLRFLPLVWSGLWRRPGRTTLALIQILLAFELKHESEAVLEDTRPITRLLNFVSYFVSAVMAAGARRWVPSMRSMRSSISAGARWRPCAPSDSQGVRSWLRCWSSPC